MNEQTIIDLKTELNTIANDILADKLSVAIKLAEKKLNEFTISDIENGHLSDVLTARFVANNHLQFTNDDQRKVAVSDRLKTDAPYQVAVQDLQTQTQDVATYSANISKNYQDFRAAELAMLYYANQSGSAIPGNLFVDANVASGEYLGTNGIIVNSNQSYKNSEYIPVIAGKNYYLNGIRGKTGIIFFENNTGTICAGSYNTNNTPLFVTAPATAQFVKFTLAQPSSPAYANILFAQMD